MGKEWIKLEKIGQLYLEKILVSLDVPILFVCSDFEKKKYLCLNVDEEDAKYVIVRTNNRYLIDMLENKVSMEFVFRNTVDKKVFVAEYDFETCLITTSVFIADAFDASLLPKKGAFFEITNKDISEYVSLLKGQLGSVYQGYYYPQFLKVARLDGSSYFNIDIDKEEILKSKNVIVSEVKEKDNYNIRIPKKLIA